MESKDNQSPQSYPSLNSVQNISFFNGDEYLAFVYKKTEKLIAALYMVSNLFPDEEPLKWNLRDKGMCLLGYNISLANTGASDKEIVINRIFSTTLEILSMFEVAFFAGFVTKMNYEILVREFNSLLSLIEKKERSEKEKSGYILSDTFFSTEFKYVAESGDRKTEAKNIPEPEQKREQQPHKGHEISARKSAVPKPALKDINERKGSRKMAIINLLKKDSNLTIKDFTKVIPDCSEKTIQRELLQLVSEGVLKKEGERRWSRYSLK